MRGAEQRKRLVSENAWTALWIIIVVILVSLVGFLVWDVILSVLTHDNKISIRNVDNLEPIRIGAQAILTGDTPTAVATNAALPFTEVHLYGAGGAYLKGGNLLGINITYNGTYELHWDAGIKVTSCTPPATTTGTATDCIVSIAVFKVNSNDPAGTKVPDTERSIRVSYANGVEVYEMSGDTIVGLQPGDALILKNVSLQSVTFANPAATNSPAIANLKIVLMGNDQLYNDEVIVTNA